MPASDVEAELSEIMPILSESEKVDIEATTSDMLTYNMHTTNNTNNIFFMQTSPLPTFISVA